MRTLRERTEKLSKKPLPTYQYTEGRCLGVGRWSTRGSPLLLSVALRLSLPISAAGRPPTPPAPATAVESSVRLSSGASVCWPCWRFRPCSGHTWRLRRGSRLRCQQCSAAPSTPSSSSSSNVTYNILICLVPSSGLIRKKRRPRRKLPLAPLDRCRLPSLQQVPPVSPSRCHRPRGLGPRSAQADQNPDDVASCTMVSHFDPGELRVPVLPVTLSGRPRVLVVNLHETVLATVDGR